MADLARAPRKVPWTVVALALLVTPGACSRMRLSRAKADGGADASATTLASALPVTKAEDNIIFALGSRPAYHALETAFQSLSETERSHAQGNLFAGIASTEYVEDFRPGHFLIRNIIGADPDSGAVVIAGIPRVGQTVQYQLRDRQSAHVDLRRVLKQSATTIANPLASLLFSCSGRGAAFFGKPNHDSGMLAEIFGPHPSSGFFCNGEIGPVAGRNCVHGYTASCAIFVETNDAGKQG